MITLSGIEEARIDGEHVEPDIDRKDLPKDSIEGDIVISCSSTEERGDLIRVYHGDDIYLCRQVFH